MRSARALAERVRELDTDPEGTVPQATLEPYVDAVLELVALVEVGRLDEAEKLDEARVDPAYEILGQTLLGAAVERADEARAVTQEGGPPRRRGRRWGTRLRGARVLTLLRSGETVVPLLFDDPRPEVRAQAAQWAGDHPD